MSDSDHDEISQLIRDVVGASKLPPKSRSVDIKPVVANLTSLVYDNGLLPDDLAQLVHLVATPSHLDQASLSAIVRNLYPADRISAEVITRIVGAFGHGKLKPSLNIQAALLKWLVMVYHALETPIILSQAYSVLFNLLDTAAIRPQLTHLLALITRRKHVRPFRIQALLNLSRTSGNDPCLVGLLRVYKDYYPEIIVGDAVRGRASAFKHPDIQWRTRLDDIQQEHIRRTQDKLSAPRDGFRVNRPVNRAARSKLIPVVHTSHATERSTTLEEIESATSFAQKLHDIELPNQLVAVLADPLLQKLLLLRPSAESHQRIANWLNAVLQDVIDGHTDQDTLWDVLEIVRDFVVQTKTFPPLILNFFARFFGLWDGNGRRHVIFEILSHAPLHEFHELYKHIFQPLETAILDDTPQSQLAILSLYTNLLHSWTASLRTSEPVPLHASDTVAELTRHVNVLSVTLLQTCPGLQTDNAILEFYEQSSQIITDDVLMPIIRIELPSAILIYTFLFSNSLATVSRMCNILACFKKGFELAMMTKTRRGSYGVDALSYDKDYVTLYNGFLMDICNCFWRFRALSNSDIETQGCMVPRPTVAALTSYVSSVEKTFSLATIFSLSHSPILCLQSIRSLRQAEEAEIEMDQLIRTRHAGPVTQTSLARLSSSGGIRLSWQDYRIGVLEHLEMEGFVGITELLMNTMIVLKSSQGSRRSSQGVSSQRGSSQGLFV
ncbi:Mis6-domain-containing protein [Stachybotrys elegans]|uniref:Mis6-domain-containing protein n=1 Tax=Stachybotrys elegans TaxID=80388 RepID=A0A8K0WQY4_9HYPO|nr:Mis6-domain-containing protein [Stachybotrys elegans]